ncbi:MAG TPA: hypothetical protein VK194_10265, partial [Candidatus Deferrimicrobium sp.]|nr:hypothetical protein [Candidatus Deferrimicrobium sp.]
MTARPISLILATGFLIVIGLSGMAAGGTFLGSVVNGTVTASDVRAAGLALGSTMAAYGFATVLAGVGLLLPRRWAWRLGTVLIIAGLVALGGAVIAAGADPILTFGVAIWGATLACLAAPATRR